jgi:cytochrome c
MARLLTQPARAAMMLMLPLAGAFSAVTAGATDAAAGRGVFATQCATCHSDARSRPTVVGPPLFGVIGRPAGSVAGYPYSTAMKSAGFVWSADRLRAYLPAPRQYLPGVKMTYGGLRNPAQLDNLIAYLCSLK